MRTMTPFIIIMLPVWACSVAAGAAAPPASQPSPAEQAEIQTLAGQLSDPARSAKTKLEAAGMLLSRPQAQAVEVLKGFLLRGDNRAAQVAIADAIVAHQVERQEFIEPLLSMLTGGDPSVRPAAARALARYRGYGVLDHLLGLAGNRSADSAMRVEVVAALQTVLDKKVADLLVSLLDDPDPSIRGAAADSLAGLTNIRTFGTDSLQWKLWWDANRDKDRWVWLSDLAESLARSKASLGADNAMLRDRLAKAMAEVYDATEASQRDAVVLGFLKDPLGDVRLAGLRLLDRRVAANETIPPDMRLEARLLLADGDARVRQEAAALTASLADKEALGALLDRLGAEDAPSVRQALLKALGQLRSAEALSAVLVEVHSRHDDVAAAAAEALARIASKSPLEGQQRSAAAEALVDRYRQAAGGDAGVREALLAAMGAVGDESFVPVLQEAMKDSSAKVRLAAVGSLGRVGNGESAGRLVDLVGDGDRGVRQAAIAALGSLGDKEQLQAVLRRTQPVLETDAAVRQGAWEAVAAILARCDDATVTTFADGLAGRSDAAESRVKILTVLTDRLRQAGSPQLASAQRKLAGALVAAGRGAEAATLLEEIHAALAAGGKPEAPAVWMEWVDALLAADDPNSIMVIKSQTDAELFAGAVERLVARLDHLAAQERFNVVVLLATEAMDHLAERLGDRHKASLRKAVEDGKARQLAADRLRVSKLAGQLCSSDEAERKAAADELTGMSDRAVLPLLEALRHAVAVPGADAQAEKAILEVLRKVSPRMTGYDPAAPAAGKTALIDSWMRDSQTRPR